MPDSINLVIFDLAGTTLSDSGQVPETFTSVLKMHGIQATPEAFRAVRGASKRQAIRSFVERQFPGDETRGAVLTGQIFAAFCSRLADRYGHNGVRPLPGAGETFAWLHQQGIKIALNLGFDRAITALVLRQAGWDRDTFAAVICGDDVSQGAQHSNDIQAVSGNLCQLEIIHENLTTLIIPDFINRHKLQFAVNFPKPGKYKVWFTFNYKEPEQFAFDLVVK